MAQQTLCMSHVRVVAGCCKNESLSYGSRRVSLSKAPVMHIGSRYSLGLGSRKAPSLLTCLASQENTSYRKYEIRQRNPNPETAGLIVVDMQNYFSSMAEPILGNVLTTIDLCRQSSMPVFFTRHNHKSPADYGTLGEWSKDGMILDGTQEAEFMPEIKRRVSESGEIVEKNTYSAFVNTRLQEKLMDMGVKEVIVTGVMTNLCCETTAREAFVRGFRVFFSTDATATLNDELHDATLMNLAFGFAYLVNCQTLRTGLLHN